MENFNITRKVRELTIVKDEAIDKLTEDYNKSLKELQDLCSHKFTMWQYGLDTYGKIACTREGILIKNRECLNCGLIEVKKDSRNDYDSEIPL